MPAGDPILAADYLGIRRGTIDNLICRIRMATAGQSIANNTTTAVNMDTEDFDPYSFHSTSSNTSRITPTVAGYYDVRGGVYMASATAVWDVAIAKNGTPIQSGQRDTAGTSIQSGRKAAAYVYCNGTTDYVEIVVTQVTGAALVVNSSLRFAPWLEARFTGRATNP
jgi:hypothetical protein